METKQENGKTSTRFSLPTFGCEGCEQRKLIMGAGDWKMDVAILLVIVALAFVMWKVKIG